MTEFHVICRGEDGTTVNFDIDAIDKDDAYELVEEQYHRRDIIRIESPQDTVDRISATELRMQSIYDNPDLDDYGY